MRQSPQTYLITGGNRGIGREFVQHYLATPLATVIAAVRDPNDPTSCSLRSLPVAVGSRLLIVQMTSGDEQSVKTAIRVLQDNGDIEKLDVVIANAAVVQEKLCRLVDVSPEEMESLIRVNAFGPVTLFRQTLPLLKRSSAPKFIVLSSLLGSISQAEKFQHVHLGAYGGSKALVNFFVRRIALEEPDILSLCLVPGRVATEAAQEILDQSPEALREKTSFLSVDESVRMMTSTIKRAKIGEEQGKFLNYSGEELEF